MKDTQKHIILEKKDKIAYITFNRPEKLNALTWGDYQLLDDIVKNCDQDKQIRVAIITGKGKAFSAGDDIEAYPGSGKDELIGEDEGVSLAMQGRYLDLQLSEYRIPLQNTVMTILNSGKVWIAAVNGICWAPEILYAMDFVVAADVATFAQGDVRNGICPGGGSTQTLPRLIGRRKAIEFLLLSEDFSAQEACRLGIVNKVVESKKLMQECEILAHKMIVHSMSSIKLVKKAVTKAQDLPLKEGLDIEQWYCTISLQSEAFQNFFKKFKSRK